MRILRQKKSIILIILVCLVSQTALGPCNKQKTLEVAAEAAKDIGGGVRDTIKAVSDAYDAKLITLEQKDRLALLLKKIAQGGQRGVDALELLESKGVASLDVPEAKDLNRIFSDEVVAPFLNFLTEMGKLTDTQSAAIRAALVTVRTAIVLLSSKIGRADIIQEIQRREIVNA